MSKISEFYAKAISDEGSKAKLGEILGGKKIGEASDEQLEKIGVLAKELGFEITVGEAKEYLSGDAELDDDELDSVAGGKGNVGINCTSGGSWGDPVGGGNPDVKPTTTTDVSV
ncbi:MAG: hypothetical protein NC253_02325 [Ruminococcus sp.]|nr:hypothetical protein [Ruminococcus sp.]MCM1382717.1 hypothetical protein [Muribaculaceae bacterium]MCM1480760.1 hypothetical protein [Muribaculaceae bacterium]